MRERERERERERANGLIFFCELKWKLTQNKAKTGRIANPIEEV